MKCYDIPKIFLQHKSEFLELELGSHCCVCCILLEINSCLCYVRCGHCKKLAPEFEKAATVLKNNDPPVTLAEVTNQLLHELFDPY